MLIIRHLFILTRSSILILLSFLVLQCGTDTCSGELATAKISSSSTRNKVWVTFFNTDTNQTFQVQNVIKGNSKSIQSLPSGRYNVSAIGYFDIGSQNIDISTNINDCADYNVFVESLSASSFSMTISSTPR